LEFLCAKKPLARGPWWPLINHMSAKTPYDVVYSLFLFYALVAILFNRPKQFQILYCKDDKGIGCVIHRLKICNSGSKFWKANRKNISLLFVERIILGSFQNWPPWRRCCWKQSWQRFITTVIPSLSMLRWVEIETSQNKPMYC
jgi:hypothetical protein